MSTQMRAIVKSVLSADTVILRGRPTNGQLPKERTLHLTGLTAPRTGNRECPDETWAFEAREFLRQLLVGKDVAFTISYTIPSGGEFGIIHYMDSPTSSVDVALEVVKNGWSKLRESPVKDADGPDQERNKLLKEFEDKAKREGLGIWASASSQPSLEVNYAMPEDPAAFLSTHKAKPLDAIVESVSNGTTLRARLLLSPTQHQLITLTMAGVRSPRSRQYTHASTETGAALSGADGEAFGDEARFFTECRLLQRKVTIHLISLPTPQATSLTSQSQPQQAMTVSSLIGIVQHPAGSIAALLLANGLARVVDWHAGFLSVVPETQGGGMERLRKAEKEGKESKRGLWKALATNGLPVGISNGNTTSGSSGQAKFEGTVSRVWGGDLLSIRLAQAPGNATKFLERKVQLSSIRAPRPTDPKLGGLASDARELLRRRLIGKKVQVHIDYVRPKEGNYEEKECATVKLPTGINVANLLVERGYATVLRHRQGEDRSMDYDLLMASEMKAQTEGKGIHSSKEFPIPKITDVSENANRANSYLSGWKRQGKMMGVVDYVASGSRFKIWFPKQDLKFTLVLSAIKCPKTARNSGEQNEPFGAEALDFANQLILQRDVEFEVESTDKSGGFIGSLYLNKTENLSVILVREGLATCHEFTLDRSPHAKELKAAEEEAKNAKKNLWHDVDAHTVQNATHTTNGSKGSITTPNKEYIDIIISDIREPSNGNQLSLSVQILINGGIPKLTQLMSDFSLHHRSASSTPNAVIYQAGDLVSAKFSADNAWYRAKIRKNMAHKKEAEVVFIDYGNSEIVSHSHLRPLDIRFKALPAQAKEATLSFVKLLGTDSEYGQEAIDRFRALVEGRKLVANVDYRDSAQNNLLHLSLYEPSDSPTSIASINHTLVQEGYALINSAASYKSAYPEMYRALEVAKMEAKRNRAGACEFGDAFDD